MIGGGGSAGSSSLVTATPAKELLCRGANPTTRWAVKAARGDTANELIGGGRARKLFTATLARAPPQGSRNRERERARVVVPPTAVMISSVEAYWSVWIMDTRWKHPWTCMLSGPTACSKTVYVQKFLIYIDSASNTRFDRIILYYDE